MSKVSQLNARKDYLDDERPLELNLRTVPVVLSDVDREQLSQSRTIDPVFNLISGLLVQVVQAKFSDGMKPKIGKLWAAWQRALALGPEMQIAAGPARWMLALLNEENLALPWQVANAREAFAAWLAEQLAPVAADKPA